MYDHLKIEKKWQKYWQDNNLYQANDKSRAPKMYILDMFPYPSGVGLHVGHPKGYIATDILSRLKMMMGYNVLHPMGFDAFGLPAENFALANKIHPKVSTDRNVATYKKQLELLGFTYDWSREINTTDPAYYKWTQWAFIKMFEKGLVYESNEPINWCPSCKTGLANEDIEDGHCERCDTLVELKPLRQWVIRITDYAERLLADLETLKDWDDSIKEIQKNWIGKSTGATINFSLSSWRRPGSRSIDKNLEIEVFTTRVDTIFGCTYVVLAPEHPLIKELADQITNYEEVQKYLETVKNKSTLDRTDLNKDKTGVELQGITAINPFNGEEVRVFVADYVLGSYGTGAVMAVPTHDERDFEFAKKYNLPIKKVITLTGNTDECLTADGQLIDSGDFSGLDSVTAREKMTRWLKKNKKGESKINYRLKDWVFSRQRYWGEPIPIIHCEKCGAVAVPEKDLPVVLPEVDSYEPSGTGESPLANISEWVNTTCPKCGGPGKRETNTMPQWAGSSWYYLRYLDPHNPEKLVDKHLAKYWLPVDVYVGGAEHAARHLIYARFWHKFLYDLGVVPGVEPFTKLRSVGLIMGEDGRKMSKRWGNVINPDEVVTKYGADALRVYEMFMGPFGEAIGWNSASLVGTRKFLDRINDLSLKVIGTKNITDPAVANLLHKTIKKVGEDIENFKFNTAVSALMILLNSLDAQNISISDLKIFWQILAPFAPHLMDELWFKSGEVTSIFKSEWPKYDKKLIKDEVIELAVQINGKLRATVSIASDLSQNEIEKIVLADETVKKWTDGQTIKKIIFVPGRIFNIVI